MVNVSAQKTVKIYVTSQPVFTLKAGTYLWRVSIFKIYAFTISAAFSDQQ